VTASDIALGLRRIRTERGLTMAQTGALLGVHVSTISRIESGERWRGLARDPRKIAALLDVTPGYLLRSCPQCAYTPPAGYQCLRCGTPAETQQATT